MVPCTRIDTPTVSYTHLRAHETEADLVCRLLLEKKKKKKKKKKRFVLQGENDECTLEELRNIIISVTDGDIPKPYDLLSLDAEQLERAMKFVQPQEVTVEVTPEILEHLKLGARASWRLEPPRFN